MLQYAQQRSATTLRMLLHAGLQAQLSVITPEIATYPPLRTHQASDDYRFPAGGLGNGAIPWETAGGAYDQRLCRRMAGVRRIRCMEVRCGRVDGQYAVRPLSQTAVWRVRVVLQWVYLAWGY